MKKYLLNLHQDLHKELKTAAALNGMSMMDFIIEAIKEKLQKEKK